MEYRVVFDAQQAGYHDWTFAAPGVAFVLLGIALVRNREALRIQRNIAFFMLGWGILWMIGAFAVTYRNDSHARDALKSGRAQMLEGTVSDFRSIPNGESFVLEGKKFNYSDYLINGCFNNMRSHGGPIHVGARVRLWAVQNCILKLEVKRDDGSPP